MKHLFRNLQFSHKILLVFLAVTVAMTIISSVVYYDYASVQIVDTFNVSMHDLMSQMNYSLSSQVSGVIRRANSLLTNRTFVTTLSNYLSQPSEKNYTVALGTVADFLNEICTSEELVQTMYVHTTLSGFDDFSHYRSRSFDFETSDFGRAYSDPDVQPLQWFPLQRDCIFTRQEWVIPFVWRFGFTDYYSDKRQYLIVQIGRDALETATLGNFQSVDYAFVLDSYGNLIVGDEQVFSRAKDELLSIDKPQQGAWEADFTFDGIEYMAMHSSLELNGWQIYILKNKTELLGSLNNLRNLILRTMLAVLAVSAALMMLIIHQMTRSLSDLAKRMVSVRNGDLKARFVYPLHDEVGKLADSFNFMLDEIEALMDKQQLTIEELRQERNLLAQVQKQKRKAELQALQAQINPHFLYNTLNAITWQAVASGDEKISTLSHALGRFFRLSLSKGAEIISVRDELEHVQNYLLIQQFRYGDKLHYAVHADETLLDERMIKLLLQPLVENALYHGIKLKEGEGSITVTLRRGTGAQGEELMIFTVSDDGVGIDAGKVAAMNDELRRAVSHQSEGYGIYNVNERIRLYYGSEYGLHYTSTPGKGTVVSFSLPLIQQEEESHVSYPDR